MESQSQNPEFTQDSEADFLCLIQDFEADFLWKVSLKIPNSGIILKTSAHALCVCDQYQSLMN